jgi:hypothetical protein
MSDLPVVITTHKRAGRVTTTRHVANCQLCVPASQAAAYGRFHDPARLIVHPDTVIGDTAKRQWIYDRFSADGGRGVFLLDDDVIGLFRIYRPKSGIKKVTASPQQAYDIIQSTADTAQRLGAYLFGFASHAHPATYDEFRPFRFGGYSPGGAMGLIAGSKLWFPADTLPIGDYWICLLNAHHHRYGFYDCRFAVGFQYTYSGVGGMADFRQADSEKRATEYLIEKFGRDVVIPRTGTRVNSLSKNSAARNPHGRSIAIPWKH